jgi:signal transduction histidine kinase
MRFPRYLLLAATLALPAVLLVQAAITFREFAEMKEVYLRSRAATIAARLETLTPGDLAGDPFELVASDEPALVDLRIYRRGEGDDPALEAIRSGRELYRTQELSVDGQRVFRAWVPFHTGAQVEVARIDLATTAADFLTNHARNSLLVALLSGVVIVVLSVYAIWSARRQLELENLARLGSLSAVLAHEIRNPLGAIKGFVQLAGEKADPEVVALLDPVLEETGRLEKLVSDLLLFGRPQHPVMRPIEWAPYAQALEAYVREAIAGRPIRFECQADPLTLETDPDLLKQVLLNLLRNAVEAAAGGPDAEVRLSVSPGRGGTVIAVEDNGPGIAESVRGRLFEPFNTTKASGTGLGLPIAKRLTEALGGRIAVRPREPGGVRVEIVLPQKHGEHSRNR